MDWIGTVVRFVVSALVLMFVGLVVPGIFAADVLARAAGRARHRRAGLGGGGDDGQEGVAFRPGVVGFIIAALVVWAAQFFVPGMSVTVLGALLAAVVIGIADLFVPTSITR